jgi:hypothetical protein
MATLPKASNELISGSVELIRKGVGVNTCQSQSDAIEATETEELSFNNISVQFDAIFVV